MVATKALRGRGIPAAARALRSNVAKGVQESNLYVDALRLKAAIRYVGGRNAAAPYCFSRRCEPRANHQEPLYMETNYVKVSIVSRNLMAG